MRGGGGSGLRSVAFIGGSLLRGGGWMYGEGPGPEGHGAERRADVRGHDLEAAPRRAAFAGPRGDFLDDVGAAVLHDEAAAVVDTEHGQALRGGGGEPRRQLAVRFPAAGE